MLKLSIVEAGHRISVLRPLASSLLHKRSDSTLATTHPDLSSIRPFQEIPGPKPLPLIGNTWRFIPGIGKYGKMDLEQLTNSLHDEYGSIVKLSNLAMKKDMVLVFDPKDAETVYRNEGQWPIRRSMKTLPYYREVLRKDFYQGIEGAAFTEGKKWQEFRSKVNQPMMQPRNTKLYVGPIDEVASECIQRMRDLRNEKGELPADLINHLNLWALESISLIALDTRMGCLSPDLKPDSEPQKMINAVHVVFEGLFELDVKPSFVHFTKKKMWKKLVKALDVFDELAIKYVHKSMKQIESQGADLERDLSVLETLLMKNDNPMVACVMALDMMLAGVDTTSHSTAVVLHYLARNQDKQEKLFQELKRVLPSKEQTITAKNLEDMKYLKACIKESMRISPISPANVRETAKDMILANFHVPKGTDIILGHKMMSNMDIHFQDVNRFVPERWLKGGEEQQKANPFVFLPFGFGPRMCVGRRFAELEMETLVSKLIRNYRLQYDQDLKMATTVINTVVSPLNFKMEERA